MQNLHIEKTIFVDTDLIVSYQNPISGKIFIQKSYFDEYNSFINLLSSPVKTCSSSLNSGYVIYNEVYSVDALKKDIMLKESDSSVKKALKRNLVGVTDEVSKGWENFDMNPYLISSEQRKALKKTIGLQKEKLTLELGSLSAQQVLCRIDTLLREKFNIKKRNELASVSFVDAIGFILAIKASSLSDEVFKTRKA